MKKWYEAVCDNFCQQNLKNIFNLSLTPFIIADKNVTISASKISQKEIIVPKIRKKAPQLPSDYSRTLGKLTSLIHSTLEKTLRIMNCARIDLYWQIATIIVEKQEISGWGEEIVEYMALDLQSQFPDIQGISTRNLWRMRRFYTTYHNDKPLLEFAREIGWTHNNIILEGTATREEREFYLRMCIRERWPYRELQKQIHSSLFERFALSKQPEKVLKTKPAKSTMKAGDIDNHFKDEYLFNFIRLSPGYSERELCQALIIHMREFLRELGKGFMFGGEEYKLRVGNEEFRIDMLFFHRDLRCLIAVEFKIGRFKPEYLGKLDFYLSALDEYETLSHENPAVGLLLCKGKDNDVVRVAMNRTLSPIKVASYKTGLPDERLLTQKLNSLAIPEEVYPSEDIQEKALTLYDLAKKLGTVSPSLARKELNLTAKELRAEVRRGQRQNWLIVVGLGRGTKYQFNKNFLNVTFFGDQNFE